MKKKGIIAIVIIILLGVIITTMFISKNNQKFIMQDGMMLAMTLTDEDGTRNITEFPERGAYNIEIDCGDTAKGIWLVEEWKLGVEDIKGNVKCNINFYSESYYLTQALIDDVFDCLEMGGFDGPTSLEEMCDDKYTDGLRYTGKNPSNWVWFNGEKWRIIGVIPTKTTSGTENLVKIIRSESIGAYAYDASSTSSSSLQGAWGSNTLYSLLNTYYYASDATKMNGQSHAGCYGYYNSSSQPKPNCDYSEIGILSSSYYGKMVKNVYWNTGASAINATPSAAYANEIGTQTVSGYIGLMTASDWGYAASSSFHSIAMNSYTSSSNKATETSWIFNNGGEWTSIQNSSRTNYALEVNHSGYLSTTGARYGFAVRPVVYLDSSVYIISGDGTEGNPYQIGM